MMAPYVSDQEDSSDQLDVATDALFSIKKSVMAKAISLNSAAINQSKIALAGGNISLLTYIPK
jgi:hypothetical protein